MAISKRIFGPNRADADLDLGYVYNQDFLGVVGHPEEHCQGPDQHLIDLQT